MPTDALPPAVPPADPEQRAAVEHLDGGLLLLAPVGSGKTRTLADRVAAALAHGLPAERLLCLTFTNRAADEMRARVRLLAGEPARRVAVHTFHALCARLLETEHRRLGLPPGFSIVDEDDAGELLRRAGAPPGPPQQELKALLSAAKSPRGALDRDDPRLHLDATPEALFAATPAEARPVLLRYQRLLAQEQALDFDDLVRLTRALLRADAPLAAAWAARFDLVQVDEVQDAHESEYEVVRALARGAGRLALIGDVDQTIYGWRGSEPRRVLEAFRRDFAPVRTISLHWNHRATQRLVRLADAALTGLPERRTRVRPAPHLEEGARTVLHAAPTAQEEAAWVARQVRALGDAGTPWARIGVLARTNARTRLLGEALRAAGVPHVSVEEFEFFRRQEVKDALALLRLCLTPDDSAAAERVLRRPARGLGDQGLARLRLEGERFALRASDLLGPGAAHRADPFARLLEGLDHGSLVVLDTETTGLSPAADEVVEVAAVRLAGGVEVDRFHALLRPTRPVGASQAVHGLSDEHLAREGRPAAEVLAALEAFVGARPVAGHNVGFDLAMLEAHGARVGRPLRFAAAFDSLALARRLLELPRYDLGSVLTHLGGRAEQAHRALGDARGAAEVLRRLAPRLREGAAERARLLAGLPPGVRRLAEDLERLRQRAHSLRPAELLREALQGAGLYAHYEAEPQRLENLADLLSALARRDDPSRAPLEALRDAVRYGALARSLALETLVEGRVPVVTVHQAKGLEFEAALVAGLVDDELPHFLAAQEGGERLAEEQRLFYVAVTRARRRLFLSHHARSERGFRRRPSRYLAALPPDDLQAG